MAGNNDHWHIDYVRLDEDRNPMSNDSALLDVSFVYDFPNFLENYEQMPWRQFDPTTELATQIAVPIADNGQKGGFAPAGNFEMDVLVTNTQTPDIFLQIDNQNFNPTVPVKNQVFSPVTDFTVPPITSDSLYVNAWMAIDPTSNNTLKSNDTLNKRFPFYNVLAYDDGSAERAYGVQGGSGVKKFAYEFNINEPDTLAAIQIHFSNIDQDVSGLVFSLYAWDSLEMGVISPFENELASIENKTPDYIDYHNGFATFAFDSGIVVQDKFYIGWAQIDNSNIQIGYDVNSKKGRDHMFIYTNNRWAASTVSLSGSPMIRAILDGSYPFENPVSIREVATQKQLHLYPNPAQDVLYFGVEENRDWEYAVHDAYGRTVLIGELENNRIKLMDLQGGVYFIKMTNDKREVYSGKFLKQ